MKYQQSYRGPLRPWPPEDASRAERESGKYSLNDAPIRPVPAPPVTPTEVEPTPTPAPVEINAPSAPEPPRNRPKRPERPKVCPSEWCKRLFELNGDARVEKLAFLMERLEALDETFARVFTWAPQPGEQLFKRFGYLKACANAAWDRTPGGRKIISEIHSLIKQVSPWQDTGVDG